MFIPNALAAQAAKAVSIDVVTFFGQSNETTNAGYWSPYPNANVGLNGPPILRGTPGSNVWTFNPGEIPGVRDDASPAAIGDYGATSILPLLPFVPYEGGRDWFDALQQEDLQHGQSAAFTFFDTLNRLGNTNRLFIVVNLARDSYGLNNYNLPYNTGATTGIWFWFKTLATFLTQIFGGYTNNAGVSKLRFPFCVFKGGEEDAGIGYALATVATGTTLTLPLSAATIPTTSAITIGSAAGDFPNTNGGTLIVDTTLGRALVTYTGATTAGFTGCSTTTGIYTGASVVVGGRIQRADFGGGTLPATSGTANPGLFYLQAQIQSFIQGLTSVNPLMNGSAFVPLFIDSQFDIIPVASGATIQPTAEIAFLAWLQGSANGVTNPLQYVNAFYHLVASTLSPGIHIGAGGHICRGEKTAQAVNSVIYNSTPWTPLYPTSVTYSGGTSAIVNFSVPFGNVVTEFNYTRVYKTGQNPICGVSYRDSGGTITITSVQITASNELTINFSASPNANTDRFIEFAQAVSYGTTIGQAPMVGTYTNFCDQDPFVSKYGQNMKNFIVPCQIGF